MQGRDPVSVHRSMQRWLSTVLDAQPVPGVDEDGDPIVVDVPWDVQPVRKEPQTRPLAVVQPLNAAPSAGTAYVREYNQPYEVFAYPVGVAGDPWATQLVARDWLNRIVRAIDSGHGAGRDRGYSMRIPLYDYTGVPVDAAIPDDAVPIDYLVVRGLDGAARQDPEQDDLWNVVVDLTLNWRDDGDRSRYDGAVLESTTIGYRP